MPCSCRKRETVLKKFISIPILFFAFHSIHAQAQQAAAMSEAIRWKAVIEESKAPNEVGIPFLKWTKDQIVVESTAFLHYTNIQGRFSEKISQATLNSKQMPVKEDGTFDIHFGFPSQSKTFIITAIDSKNKVFRMRYKIVAVDHQEVLLEKMTPNRWRFSAGGGLTRLSFRQRNVVPFGQWALTVKGSAAYRLIPEKLDLAISSFFNALAIGSNSPANYKIQYLGVNTRVVWNLLGPPSQLRINLSAGFYYNTSLSLVGFINMYGPQLYPEFIYVFDNGNSMIFYGKFSPALSQTMHISFSENREVAMGLHYSFPITMKNRMTVGMDLSQLSLQVPNGDWASTNTYSLSAGISF